MLIIPLLLIIKDLFNIAFPFMYGIFFMLIVGFILALPLFVKLTKGRTIMVNEQGTILFDGVCNLCNGLVQIILKRDRHNRFQFASLQSDAGRDILERYKLKTT